ncbi:MAG: VWA domain-containing protein [Cytophagales bacterium]|nr:VWA domain-containing protein [Cytophagales bacterium]
MFDTLFDKNTFEWFSYTWFTEPVLRGFSYENPSILYLALAAPLLFLLRWIFHFSFRQKLDFAFPQKKVKSSWVAWLRYIPDIVFILFIINIIIALARPQKTNENVEQWTEGIDIMLVLDISESMQMEDFTPNRLEAAKKVARNFIKGRFQDRIGVVIFSGDAYSLSPLTTDYNLLTGYIEDIKFDLIRKGGTAIGSALAIAINRLRESDSKSKVIILLSDGDNTAGNINPITAAELAHAFNIKVYTIAVGKDGQVPFGKDMFGNVRYVNSALDETTLRKIATIGEGKFYRASSNSALKNIFNYIDKYEKAEIKETRYRDTKDYYYIYLTWSLVLFCTWLMLKNTFLSNWLED